MKVRVALRLELENVPGLRRLEQTDRDRIERAAEVAAERLDAPLAAGRRVEVQHRGAGAPQIAHEALLLALAGIEQAQHAPGPGGPGHPAEVEPERALALLADLRGPEVLPKAIAGLGLVRRVDGGERGRGPGRQRRHQPSSRTCCRSFALVSARSQASSS